MGRYSKEKHQNNLHLETQKHAKIYHVVANTYRLKREMAALLAFHLKPLRDAKTRVWRDIKANTGTEADDNENDFLLARKFYGGTPRTIVRVCPVTS